MQYEAKQIQLKNNKKAIFRSPTAEDAHEMINYLKTCASETEFILRYPEECVETDEQEAKFLTEKSASKTQMMIVCEMDGQIAGSCQISFNNRLKIKHRASVSIVLLKKYWNLGIGTAMFEEMIKIAKQKGVSQMELEFVEGNDRALRLYEKLGFHVVAEKPNAIRLKNGSLLKEFFMIKELS